MESVLSVLLPRHCVHVSVECMRNVLIHCDCEWTFAFGTHSDTSHGKVWRYCISILVVLSHEPGCLLVLVSLPVSPLATVTSVSTQLIRTVFVHLLQVWVKVFIFFLALARNYVILCHDQYWARLPMPNPECSDFLGGTVTVLVLHSIKW